MARCGRGSPQSISALAGHKRAGPFPLPTRIRPGFVPLPRGPLRPPSAWTAEAEERPRIVSVGAHMLEAWARVGPLGSAGLVFGASS